MNLFELSGTSIFMTVATFLLGLCFVAGYISEKKEANNEESEKNKLGGLSLFLAGLMFFLTFLAVLDQIEVRSGGFTDKVVEIQSLEVELTRKDSSKERYYYYIVSEDNTYYEIEKNAYHYLKGSNIKTATVKLSNNIESKRDTVLGEVVEVRKAYHIYK